MHTGLKNLRRKLDAHEVILGSHVFCGTGMLTEAIAMCGFDVIWIDMEHTAIDNQKVLENLIACRAGGAAGFVRIRWNDPVLAKPIIDMGADGVIFPYIRTAEEAKLAVASCEYPPKGIRGFGPLRALDYGQIPVETFVDDEYRNMLRILQIEHIDAVENLEAIADVEGIDAFIVGPNDLAGSVGHIGRPNHPDMLPIHKRLAEILVRAGIPFGVSVGYDPETLRRWMDLGARIFFCGHDSGYVQQGACRMHEEMSALLRPVS